ncbi:uncharacterized protein LOC107407377 [Ziziphus jujuba]|uniref:Uncharacterized protein LOC107407377 n=2 Tax=Ziziphus jujuba TaxID=326968 RepID=A0A6P3Z7I8_ZIZJJ|nr:uncharacterized protein LOC107407377 [Ziziphus jujuba]KAH7546918.1 hypothetical protein FEM48_Zijuj01G0251700 [Ziziphus jujuba var. spinosa]
MDTLACSEVNAEGNSKSLNVAPQQVVAEIRNSKEEYPNGFQLPLHYPRYTKLDYEKKGEWKLDMLLKTYGLSFVGSLEKKRAYAIGTFLWPDQL